MNIVFIGFSGKAFCGTDGARTRDLLRDRQAL